MPTVATTARRRTSSSSSFQRKGSQTTTGTSWIQFNVGYYIFALIFLVAPTTPKKRIRKIANKTRGFLYAVSVTGVASHWGAEQPQFQTMSILKSELALKAVI